mmetsp:Transcript_9875/g.29041  ORF Transcript_9875/g.29041 Transcript_9875/m.29041 type:complete len:394 (-) Transcript_9875:95-1276(-)
MGPSSAGCTPSNSSVFAFMPIFYITQFPDPALEARFRAAGACGEMHHVPAVMAEEVFAKDERDPFPFNFKFNSLPGNDRGHKFDVFRADIPPRSRDTCPSPSLFEVGVLLSHLRALAMARHDQAVKQPRRRSRAVLIVEADVDVSLVPAWGTEVRSVGIDVEEEVSECAMNLDDNCDDKKAGAKSRAPVPVSRSAFDALFEALPPEWGIIQLALATTSQHFRQLRDKFAAGTIVVPHGDLVSPQSGRNEGWSTAAYAVSQRGLKAMVDEYCLRDGDAVGQTGKHEIDDFSCAQLFGRLRLTGKGCLRADYLLYDGHVTSTWVAARPLFLYSAGSLSSSKHAKRTAGVQIGSIRNIVSMFYGYSPKEALRAVIARTKHARDAAAAARFKQNHLS